MRRFAGVIEKSQNVLEGLSQNATNLKLCLVEILCPRLRRPEWEKGGIGRATKEQDPKYTHIEI